MIQNALAQHRSRLDFSHTPLCKALWYSGLFLSLVVMLVDGRDLFWFSPIEIIQHPRQWVMRTAFSTLFYSGSLGLCIGLFLLYKFRIFERNLGTQKFSVLVLLAFFLNVVFNISALALTLSLFQANSPELSALISPAKGTAGTLPASAASSLSLLKRAAILPTNGLEWLISALLVLYVSDVPRGYVFRVFGVCMSDKWLVYTLYAQLLLAGLPHNILPAAAGILAGVLYNSGGLGLNEKTAGPRLSAFCSALCLPIVDPSLTSPQQQQQQASLGTRLSSSSSSSSSSQQQPSATTAAAATTTTIAPSSSSSSSNGSNAARPGQRPVNNDFKDNYAAIAAAITPPSQQQSSPEQDGEGRRRRRGHGGRRNDRGHQQHQSQQTPTRAEDTVDEQFQRDVEEAISASLMDAVDPAAVEAMTAMGFSEEQARDALAHTGCNVEAAVARLLGN